MRSEPALRASAIAAGLLCIAGLASGEPLQRADHPWFRCAAAPGPNAVPPPALDAGGDTGASESAPPLCPAGQRPEPIARRAPKGRLIPGVRPSPKLAPSPVDYLYDAAQQYASTTQAGGFFSVDRPYVAAADYHSLAELAIESADAKQIVEVGWTVDRGVNADSRPHLFVYHWVDGAGTCYNGCGFVSTSNTVVPGATLPVGATGRLFAIRHFQRRWWINYRGRWIGYFPDSIWKGRFQQIGLAQWFGEVCATSTKPATWMGNGLLGTRMGSATIKSYYTVDGSGHRVAASPGFLQTDKSLYAIGAIAGGFRYGGPKSH